MNQSKQSPPSKQQPPSGWQFDHFNVNAADNAPGLQVLCDILNLQKGHRPPFPFPGSWYYLDGHPILHVIENPSQPAPHFNHLALRGNQSLAAVVAKLETTNIPFWVKRVPAENTAQVFLQLSQSLVIELDLPLSGDNDALAASYSGTAVPSFLSSSL